MPPTTRGADRLPQTEMLRRISLCATGAPQDELFVPNSAEDFLGRIGQEASGARWISRSMRYRTWMKCQEASSSRPSQRPTI